MPGFARKQKGMFFGERKLRSRHVPQVSNKAYGKRTVHLAKKAWKRTGMPMNVLSEKEFLYADKQGL